MKIRKINSKILLFLIIFSFVLSPSAIFGEEEKQYRLGEFVYVNNKVRCVFPSVPSLPVSEAKPKDDTHIIIYPNPCNNILNINNIENADVSIYDMYAHLLLTDNSKDTWRSINISGLSDGIYIMHIKFKDNFIIKKIIKNGKD